MADSLWVAVFAVVSCVPFYILGRLRPALALWSHVDLWYYSLGVVGVVLLFAATVDSRNRISVLAGYQQERETAVRSAASEILKSSYRLTRFLGGNIDKTLTCTAKGELPAPVAQVCQQTFLSKLALGLMEFPGVADVPGEFMVRDSFVSICNATIAAPLTERSAWQALHTLSPEIDEQLRNRALMLSRDIVNACTRYIEVVARLNTPIQPAEGKGLSEMIPTPGYVLVSRVKEWAWPFVLIFAFSLKIGKAAAALQTQR